MKTNWNDTFESRVASFDDRRKCPYFTNNDLFSCFESSNLLEEFRGEVISRPSRQVNKVVPENSDKKDKRNKSRKKTAFHKINNDRKDKQGSFQDPSGKKQIRMQEIEDRLMETGNFRIIDGFLCIWNGRYYRRLNLDLFNMVARTHLTEEQEDKISAFKRFEDAYKFMLANEELRGMFSEKSFESAKKMIVFENGVYQ